ncbi:SMEK domain-containing protein [Sphingobacterium cellulitidis]|uniref:SMEK domain-containing protein n=1 Tax=Sphingobacterium cellulitidis TaxID=1768011 RepID=UPI000B943E7D|nr:hypothetical protein CHT99_07905 [Sphingobacterium cellulitidis]
MKTENYLREIRDIFAHLAFRTKLDNNNGYSDLNKYVELLFMSIFGQIYDKEFKQFTKVNYPTIDLYSFDNEIAIQISSDSSTTKVKKTLNMFIDNNFDLKYKKLYILFLKDESNIKKESIQKILVNSNYSKKLIKTSIFSSESLLDFSRLCKEIENLPSETIEKIHSHLDFQFPQRVSRMETLQKDIPEYPEVQHHITRHLTNTDHTDYWAQFFEKETLVSLVIQCLENVEETRIIVKANAGQGKSVELDHLAHQLQQTGYDISPVLINIKNYTSKLNKFISEKYPHWNDADKSNALLLIDGLDEINPSAQQDFISDFNHLLECNPKLKVICTIRSNFDSRFFSCDKNHFKEYFIHPLFEKDILNYINQYSQQSDVLKKLIKKPWVKDIVSIPFYLVELVDLSNDHNKKLPNNLKDFYHLIIQRRLDRDYYKYKGRLDKEEVFKTLQKIAIYMTLQGINSVKLSKLTQLNNFSKEDYKSIPFFSIYEDNLEDHLSFLHNNFQEFLAAEWLSRQSWEVISAIIFNDKTSYLNTKLLNTTVILFSILDKKTHIYTSLTYKIKYTDYTIFFYVEKERLAFTERFDIFKKFILDGKEKGLAYLSGDFSEQDLFNFIDYDIAGLNFILDELKEDSKSSNHFHSLLYLIWGFPAKKLTKRKTTEILLLIQEFILKTGYKELEYELLIKIAHQLGKFDEGFLNNFVKKCPLFNHRLVLTRVIELIDQNNIPNQFENIIKKAEDLSKNGTNWVNNHERIFSKYVLDNLHHSNYQYLLNQLSADNNFYLTKLLNARKYFGSNSLKFIDQVYLKLAEIANKNNSEEVIGNLIHYINEIHYDSYSRDTYGDLTLFFSNIREKDLFRILLTNNTILERGYIFNKLFDLENTDCSKEIIELYRQTHIDADRLKMIYLNTFSNASTTSLNLSRFMSTEFPDEFRIITPLSTLQNQWNEWKINGLKLLSNKKEYIQKIHQVVDYIKDHYPEFINEQGILDFDYRYHDLLNRQFENSIVIDFVDYKSHNNIIDTIPYLLDDDQAWHIHLGKQIKLHQYEESQKLIVLKNALQDYVHSILSSIDFTSCREKELNRDNIEVQIAIWFKEGIIHLPFETAIQLICHDSIDEHTLDRVRMNDFLIEIHSLETIKPYLIKIIQDQLSSTKDVALAIRTCIDHKIKDIEEEIFEMLCFGEIRLRILCSDYLIKMEYNNNILMRYLEDNPLVSHDWQMSLVEYLYNNEINHSSLLAVIEGQVEFDPDLEYMDYIPRSLCKYGLRLGSHKCMLIFFKYLKDNKYPDSNIRYEYFENIRQLYPDELFLLCLEAIEIYKDHIRDHGRSDICGMLDNNITNLASEDVDKYHQTILLYNRLIIENKDTIPSIRSLEWWKIRLTKKFQERNSRYLSESKVLSLI